MGQLLGRPTRAATRHFDQYTSTDLGGFDMRIPTAHATPGQGWGLPFPWLRGGDGKAVKITGGRPTWHLPIFFLGLAGPLRTALTGLGLHGVTATMGTYLVCIAAALVIGHLIEKKANRPQTARVLSATLGTIGFAVTGIISGLPIATLLVPAGVYVLPVAGELLSRWFPQPAARDKNDPAHGPAPATEGA
jgi:hypothetical protein